MAEKVLGLAGPGEGAWISTRNLKHPKAKISGLTESATIVVECSDEPETRDDNRIHELEGNGVHVLGFAPFMRVIHKGSCRTMVCTFFSGAQVAVP